MSSGVTDYGAGLLVGQLLGVTAVPAQYYVALCTDQVGEGMDGDILADLEPVDTAYARVPVSIGGAHWALNGQFATNLDTLDFGVPLVAWGQISHYALCDAPTSGNVVAFGEFLSPQYVDATFDVVIPPGGLIMALYGLENSITV